MTGSWYFNKEKNDYVFVNDDTDRMNYLGALKTQSNYYAFQGFNSVIDIIGQAFNQENLNTLLVAQYKRCFDQHNVRAQSEFVFDKRSGVLVINHQLVDKGVNL